MTDQTPHASREASELAGPASLGPGALGAIERPARRAERRLRLGRALAAGTTAACVALVLGIVTLALRKLGVLHERPARVVVGLLLAVPLVTAAFAWARVLPARAGAVALDRFHGLSDRLSSALSFASLPASEQTPFMRAAIDDALGVSGTVDPRRAVPLRAPRDLAAAAALMAVTIVIAVFEVRRHEPVTAARTIDAVDVTADDLDAMREFLQQMKQRDQSEEAKAATQEFNQLIEDLAAKRLDRTEAFRKMQALEDKLLEGREADAKALEDALQKIGDEMKKADLTRPAGEALDTKNLADAEKRLKELAKKLREQGASLDKSQLEKMRDALKKASSDQAKRQQALAQRRDELEKQLLQQKQKQPDGGAEDEEKSLLQKRERELERLNRETQQQEATGRQLDRLDRELAQAAEDLMKDLGASAQDLERGAEDINRMAREQMTQEEKEQLRQKLQELRETIRQQGQAGQGQMARLRRFQQQARGQSGQGGAQQGQGGQEGQEGQEGQQGQGQQGQGQQGQGQQGRGQQGQGQQGQGQNGQGQNGQGQQGQGQNGQGQGQGGQPGETWVLGPNGEKLLMLSQSRSSGGSGQGQNGGRGDGPPGSQGYGTGHDGRVQGAATGSKVGTQDTQIAGQDTGQGGSRSEVIAGAAERGFASRGYQKVYREYHTVAEEALDRDEIPGGYRFYVRRYFQLIRPRDARDGESNPGGPSSPSNESPDKK